MNMLPRIAVLGCGYWGSNHAHTLKSLGVLSAVSDINYSKAKKLSNKYNVMMISCDLLFDKDNNIDAIVIALPPKFHANNAIKSVENGKDVFVEKPIALNVKDAEIAIQAAKKNKRVFMAGHIIRFHPAFKKLLSLVSLNILGDIRYIYSHRLGLGNINSGIDVLWDLAPHDLSMILSLTKKEPLKVYSKKSHIFNCFADVAHIYMKFCKNIDSHLLVSRINPYRERRLTVIGTRAVIVFNDMESWDRKIALYKFNYYNNIEANTLSYKEVQYFPTEEKLPLTIELKHFIDCIKKRKTPITNGKEAISILKILQNIEN